MKRGDVVSWGQRGLFYVLAENSSARGTLLMLRPADGSRDILSVVAFECRPIPRPEVAPFQETEMEKITIKDLEEFAGFCRAATDAQLSEIFRKERDAGRSFYAREAAQEMARRGLPAIVVAVR